MIESVQILNKSWNTGFEYNNSFYWKLHVLFKDITTLGAHAHKKFEVNPTKIKGAVSCLEKGGRLYS